MKHWKILSDSVNETEIIKTLLRNRGLTEEKEIQEFLNPQNPSNLKPEKLGLRQQEIDQAIKRIKKAIKNKEKIIIYGDYDADGICGTAILWETLRHLGGNVLPYIPHRTSEGYGLSQKGIDNLLTNKPYFGASQNTSHQAKYALRPKPSLIVTVDQGITARKEVDYAQKNGLEVIITDHHQKPKKLPQALATIWTDQISGAAVAWILARELDKSIYRNNLKADRYLDLVAIATIADLLPLKGPNRSLVKYGLIELNQTQRPGLLALIEEARLLLGKIGAWEVGYILAPRLNASGRIEHALDSLRLLCTRGSKQTKTLAQKLGEINRERQRLTNESFLHARELVQKSSKLIFISHPSYNEGVVGLVAGKLTEEFWRPAIVVSEGEIHSKASARSINGFNIIEAIRKFENLLLDCGGHPMAAGFTVETVRLKEIQKQLLETAENEITPEQLEKTLKIDCEIKLEDVNWTLYEAILKFAPFGNGNPEPVFLTRQVKLKDIRTVGANGKHLKLVISSPESSAPYALHHTLYSGIGFGLGGWGQKLKAGGQVDLVYTLLVDSWNGEERLQLKIKDLKPSD